MTDFLLVYAHWPMRLLLAVLCLFWFFAFLRAKWLVSDSGNPYVHHSWLILLIVLPSAWASWVGWLAFLDDVANHSLKRWWPGFQSPLHALGYPLYVLRDQLGYRLPEGKIRDWLLTL